MIIPAWYGLLAQCLIVAGALRFARDLASPARRRSLLIDLVIPAVAVALVPISGLPIAAHLRGLWGDPSVITALLLLAYVLWPVRLPHAPKLPFVKWIAIFVFVPLYLRLFVGSDVFPIDLYSIGWRPWGVLSVIVAIAFIGWRRLDLRWVRLVAFALIAYGLGVMESTNIFDYLLDPGLAIGLVVAAIVTRKSRLADSAIATALPN